MKKKIIIGSMLLLISIVLGSTLAWWTWSTSADQNTNVVVTVEGVTINYEDGEDITNNNLIPTTTKEKGMSKQITISSTRDVYLDLNMQVITLDDGLKEASFKYGLYDSKNMPVIEGNFASSNAEDTINLLKNITITSSPITYTLYIWIDGNMTNPSTMYNQNFEFRLNASATDQKPRAKATEEITSIYTTASKTEVVNNHINYNYAIEVDMMEDIGGNIRYYGEDPNNYVSFNNELWRIIGVFKDIDDGTGNKENRIKIIKAENLTYNQWDDNENKWAVATLNTHLNGEYLNSLTAESQEMIGEAVWNFGGNSLNEGLYANDYYTFERGDNVYLGQNKEWTGEIALMYPSDYMYAGDLSKCSVDGYNWNETNCSDTSWIKNSSSSQWTLTQNSNDTNTVYCIHPNGTIDSGNSIISTNIVSPVLFLKSSIIITGGEGTSTNPFKLSLN